MLHGLTLARAANDVRNPNKHEHFGVADVARRRGFRFVKQNGAQEHASV